MITNMTAHMEAFLMSHGGIDMDQFYEDYSDVTVDGIVEALTSKLIEALTEDDNQDKLKALVPKRQPKEKSDKIKDPNKPKRGKTAYFFFCDANREQAKAELLEETDQVTVGDVSRRLGAWWKEFKEDEDRKDEYDEFVAQADEDKERYKTEMEDYTEPTQEELKATVGEKKKRSPAKKKDPDAPKKPKAAYHHFCADQRETVKSQLTEANGEEPSFPEVNAELGVRWADLKASTNRKDVALMKKYTAMVEEEKSKYEASISTAPKPAPKPAPKAAPKAASKAAKTVPKAAAKPASKAAAKPPSGWNYYCSQHKEDLKAENPTMTDKEIQQELASRWRDQTPEEKAEWTSLAEGEAEEEDDELEIEEV